MSHRRITSPYASNCTRPPGSESSVYIHSSHSVADAGDTGTTATPSPNSAVAASAVAARVIFFMRWPPSALGGAPRRRKRVERRDHSEPWSRQLTEIPQWFEHYWDVLQKGLGRPLGYRSAMQRLNEVRVDLKHYGIEPAPAEIPAAVAAVEGLLTDETPA